MTKYSMYAFREQRVLVTIEANSYKEAVAAVDQFDGQLTVEPIDVIVEDTLQELYDIDVDSIEEAPK